MNMSNERVHKFDSCDSTNQKAKEIAREGAEIGTVVVARSQSAGRGRGGRKWHSPPGGLYFSILLSPNPGRRSTDLPLLAGVAMAQAIKESLPKSKDISLKWPNDILIDWKKVCGILCEGLADARISICVIGIGVNVNVPLTELSSYMPNPFKATSFSAETGGQPFDLDELLSVCLRKITTLYDVYRAEGFGPIQYLWEKNCRMVGKRVELRESGVTEAQIRQGVEGGVSARPAAGTPATVGTLLGIDDSGGLMLSNSKGERAVYYTGELTCFWP